MSTAPRLSDLARGEVVGTRTVTFTRADLVAYAGASGDRNPIHWSPTFAEHVGLPGVIAHGMLTMGAAIQPLIAELGDPGRVVDYQVRFTKPVVVDPVTGADVHVIAKVAQLADEDGIGRIDLEVSCEGVKVLGKSQVRVRFAA